MTPTEAFASTSPTTIKNTKCHPELHMECQPDTEDVVGVAIMHSDTDANCHVFKYADTNTRMDHCNDEAKTNFVLLISASNFRPV